MADNFGNVFEDLKKATWITVHSRLSEVATECDLSINLQKLNAPMRREFMVRMEDSGLGQAWRQNDSLYLRVKSRNPQELRSLLSEIASLVKAAERSSSEVA